MLTGCRTLRPLKLAVLLALSLAALSAHAAEDDPLEPVNRAVFAFNETADRWLLKPLAKGYRKVTPDYFEETVTRFFANLSDVGSAANSLLQGKPADAGNYSARFLINTTVGVGGLFDVAEPWGFEPGDGEDLGQTFAVWGIPSGPYLVLPLLGPSSMRDGIGRVGDHYSDPVSWLEHDRSRSQLTALEVISLRANLLNADGLVSGDRYRFVKDAWQQRRDYLINDGAVQDDFGDDLDFLD